MAPLTLFQRLPMSKKTGVEAHGSVVTRDANLVSEGFLTSAC